VNEFLNNSGASTKILNIGIPDYFPSIGSPADQKTEANLEKTKIIEQINKKLDS
jgi:deoxyxylulose-5-phosphate synthase